MNEGTASMESQITPQAPATSRRPPRPPAWLRYVALALMPALVVGLLIYFLTGGSTEDRAAGIVDGFIRLGEDEGENTQSFIGKLPPGFPAEFPNYASAQVVVSFTITSTTGTNYFVLFSTAEKPEKVLAFYQDKLNDEPWQVEAATASADFIGLLFSRPDNANVQGQIRMHHSELDNKTTLFLTYQDVAAVSSDQQTKPFVLQPSRPLPSGFPSDVPIYKDKESTVIETSFSRGAGGTSFLITFITKDGQSAVVNFYRQEFQKRGWTVTDSTQGGLFAQGIDFSDGPRRELQGTIVTDVFDGDTSYTRIDMQLQVSSARRRSGN